MHLHTQIQARTGAVCCASSDDHSRALRVLPKSTRPPKSAPGVVVVGAVGSLGGETHAVARRVPPGPGPESELRLKSSDDRRLLEGAAVAVAVASARESREESESGRTCTTTAKAEAGNTSTQEIPASTESSTTLRVDPSKAMSERKRREGSSSHKVLFRVEERRLGAGDEDKDLQMAGEHTRSGREPGEQRRSGHTDRCAVRTRRRGDTEGPACARLRHESRHVGAPPRIPGNCRA